jgi:hypothetical protein
MAVRRPGVTEAIGALERQGPGGVPSYSFTHTKLEISHNVWPTESEVDDSPGFHLGTQTAGAGNGGIESPDWFRCGFENAPLPN